MADEHAVDWTEADDEALDPQKYRERLIARAGSSLDGEVTTATTPIQVAKLHVATTRYKRTVERELARVKKLITELDAQVLELIETEQLPPSSKISGASLYTREELWVSPKVDHEHLASVLREVGLTEYLPKSVNSQSMSAYVRGYYNKETGDFTDDIDARLLDALKVSIAPKVVVNG